jgi:hypothetical protein
VPDPDSEHHSQSPCLQKLHHSNHATIAATLGQRRLTNRVRWFLIGKRFAEVIDAQYKTAGRAVSIRLSGGHSINPPLGSLEHLFWLHNQHR